MDKQKIYGKPGFCIVTGVDRPPREALERLSRFPAAIIGDGMRARGIMQFGIKPLHRDSRICGPAITVESQAADNLMIHAGLRLAQQGDVLVVSTHGDLTAGVWGELTTRMAIRKRLGGIVIDGMVRDSSELIASGFPVFCRGVCPRGGGKEGPGQVNLPISCGGVPVKPGDVIVGDADGVVVVPGEFIEEAIEGAQKKTEIERLRFAAIAGEDPKAIYPAWLIPTLRHKGVLGPDEDF